MRRPSRTWRGLLLGLVSATGSACSGESYLYPPYPSPVLDGALVGRWVARSYGVRPPNSEVPPRDLLEAGWSLVLEFDGDGSMWLHRDRFGARISSYGTWEASDGEGTIRFATGVVWAFDYRVAPDELALSVAEQAQGVHGPISSFLTVLLVRATTSSPGS